MPLARLRVFGVLLVGILAVSFASIIITVLLRDYGTPAPVVAASRLVFSSLILTPFFWVRRRSGGAQFAGVDWRLLVLAGLLLAAHFATWVESLRRTSVTSSVVLVALNPIFAAALSPLLLKERVTVRQWVAVGLGILGAAVIAGSRIEDASTTSGNLLAVVGAFFAAGYLMVGRKLRVGLSLVSYVYVVYSICALVLLGFAVVVRAPFGGLKPAAYGLMFLLALGPQLVGHTSFNYALRYLSAPAVAMGVLGEPVGTTLLAWLLLKRSPTPAEALGGTVICVGIYLAATVVTKNRSGARP